MPIQDDFMPTELEIMRRVSGLPIDELALAVASNLWRASQAFKQKLEREVLRQQNLSFSSFSTLFIVWIWGPIETREIAKSQGISKATVTSLLNTLEKNGLVRRKTSRQDKRLVLAELTPAGKNTIEWVFPKFNQGEAEMAGLLTEAEQLELSRLLRKIATGLKTTEEVLA
jgi:MarR family transcriptional regulator, 2-MHQ and catechol-resistance regulon repressor